jgi:hypothetical protein
MRKLTLLVALLTAASVSIASAAPKKKAIEPEDPNANSVKLMKDGLPLVMPSAVMYYMLYQKQTDAEKEAAAKTSAKRKKTAQ